MKAKEESSYKETEQKQAAKRKESASEPKGEKTTPKKMKGSPTKREVGPLWKVCNLGIHSGSSWTVHHILPCCENVT